MKKNKILNLKTYNEAIQKLYYNKKESCPEWTMGQFARDLNLSSTSSISNILYGRKLPSLELGRKISVYFRLSLIEENYFLVLLEKERFKSNTIVSKALSIYLEKIQVSPFE